MSMIFFLISLGMSLVGALLAILTSKNSELTKTMSCIIGSIAAVFSAMAGILAMVGPTTFVDFGGPFSFASFSIMLNPLTGVLVTVISLLTLTAWIYGMSYFDEYVEFGLGGMCMFMNLFVFSMLLVVSVDNAFWFLVNFELMSLTSFFLVVVEQTPKALKAGYLYLIMAHIGFMMIMISFLIMASITGSFDFSAFRAMKFTPAIASICFVLAFLGFGFKAGMIPFHQWLPLAHPAAPSNVSALMSGGMIKIGIFGAVKVGFDLLGASQTQLWWGVMVMLFGAVSSVLGVIYALNEHDIKRLLAYHSVENIGIILIGVGVAICGAALDMPLVAGLGLMASLYHLFNHAMFKGLLFLGAGSVMFRTHTRNMEKMGGLVHVMPWTAAFFLIGSLAISAIPPLNGFVSEWFTYQSLFNLALGSGTVVMTVTVFTAVALAITGALAVTCFVKAYGVTFSGTARSEEARNATESPVSMLIAMGILSAICIAAGLFAPQFATVFQGVASSLLSQPPVEVMSTAAILNTGAGTLTSTLGIFVIGGVLIALAAGAKKVFATGGQKVVTSPWAQGYNPEPEMTVTASSFAANVKQFFGPLYGKSGIGLVFVNLYHKLVSAASKTEPVPDKVLVDAPVSIVEAISRRIEPIPDKVMVDAPIKLVDIISKQMRHIENGDFRYYVMYIVAALVIFLALASWM